MTENTSLSFTSAPEATAAAPIVTVSKAEYQAYTGFGQGEQTMGFGDRPLYGELREQVAAKLEAAGPGAQLVVVEDTKPTFAASVSKSKSTFAEGEAPPAENHALDEVARRVENAAAATQRD